MKKTTILLILIILFGAFLRVYKLDKFPPSLFGDEVDVGYQAYSILKTGKDYSGQSWPISFRSVSDWRTPLFLYADVPFIAIFGLNEWGVRLSAAIFGILILPMFFLLIRKMFKNETLALIGTFFLSISMWHLQYSRAAFEVTLMLFLLVTGIYFFLLGLKKWKYLFLSAIFLALTPYSYNTAKLFLPLLLIMLIISFYQPLKLISYKKLLLALMIFIIVSLPMAYDVFFGKGGNRFSVLSIFTDPTVIPQVGFDRQVDLKLKLGNEIGVAPAFDSRLFHNKFLYWGMSLIQNYFKVFSTDFLFVRGDINLRHSIQGGFGQFYWFDVIFLIMGFVYLLKMTDRSVKKFVLLLFFIAPVPSVLTKDGGYHATRLILLLLPATLIMGLGAYQILKMIGKFRHRWLLIIIFCVIMIVQFSLYLHRYYVHYPLESEEWWNYGFKQTAPYIMENEGKYDFIVFSDKDQPPLIYTLFWLKIDPGIIQRNNKLKEMQISDAVWADQLLGTKYYFGHVSNERVKANGFIGTLKPNILYIMPEREIAKDFRYEPVPNSIELLQTIYYPSGRVAKYIFTGK